jgi:hypothetical protein
VTGLIPLLITVFLVVAGLIYLAFMRVKGAASIGTINWG